jgi:hypothetical protein
MPDVRVEEAAKEMGVSKFLIYQLPKDTPGLYKYDRALRVNIEELRAWARNRTIPTSNAKKQKNNPT